LEEVYALAQHVPSPASSRDLKDFGITLPLLFGTQAAVDVAEIFKQTFEQRIASGTSGVPDERARLLWIQNRIQFRNPVIELLEQGFGASIVVDELNTINWDPIDPDDPWTDIAVRTIAIPLNGPIESRIRHLGKLARDYKIHGAVNPCHWGCRQGTGARGLIQEGVGAFGIPVLNLEVDCVDPRSFSDGQVRTRLEAFLEMIENRPSPWS
ncbi:MAG: 2-hydroxyacyl-CoA dehydratase, partial [Deltaproteobacteria bacterium]|nr:2-hydroxyacyl-CoA dehydratase [Deltaproteobacteria bacterium]